MLPALRYKESMRGRPSIHHGRWQRVGGRRNRAGRQWGEDCTAHLVGDFAFALWDSRQQRLFCARDHIGARPDDLASLVSGLIAFDRGAAESLDAVVAAATLAFGFVYIHPFEDGNGRIHRYLMHHALARRGFNPRGVHFPVSAAILDRIDEYRSVLESYSRRLLPVVRWEPTESHNVRVSNDTADFYRFFDATPHAEFLYACVRQTIEQDLPREARFLENFDRFRAAVAAVIDMPDRTLDNLLGFLRQNGGRLSKRAREQEFAALTEEETRRIERAYADSFGVDES